MFLTGPLLAIGASGLGTAPTMVLWALASYLLGAIPTSLIVARVFGDIDLRTFGSGNLGATNLYRALGLRFAAPVAAFDAVKGAVPVLVGAQLAPENEWAPILCGLAAVVGHVFSLWVRFKGGKGVATGAGVILALAPLAVVPALVLWTMIVLATGYAAVGSIAGAVSIPLAVVILYPGRPLTLALISLLSLFIIWKHRSNVARVWAGTENKVGPRGRSKA